MREAVLHSWSGGVLEIEPAGGGSTGSGRQPAHHIRTIAGDSARMDGAAPDRRARSEEKAKPVIDHRPWS